MINYPDLNKDNIRYQSVFGKKLVISFCASWCHNCESWKDTFTLLSERFVDDCFIWIDIDEYPELVSEIDLDVIPVVLIQKKQNIHFLGPIRPGLDAIISILNSDKVMDVEFDPGVREYLSAPDFQQRTPY
ncbi:thioredoxin family protein [Providencia rettgeri]|uniref:Thioredoxin family protein n=1 Tax=Providencia hangzhouensis TaxID=3031799 RepID=A0ABY9Z6G2_9GAMM|nr:MULTISPECIES: thioredoxin family protein [Providencia]MBN6365287.1 thioredoxin family protein [Providencia rettgeri]MCL0009990.1 thioredoxin family protein [Providencia rettgeri]MDH2377752.1 thioredoxin family protein [Providencia rettgeri]QLI98000.1 thioredoxin family protein [Providencia rettgeri]WNK23024.1 thioredoxin family protein [Providencia hangzhouensis]